MASSSSCRWIECPSELDPAWIVIQQRRWLGNRPSVPASYIQGPYVAWHARDSCSVRTLLLYWNLSIRYYLPFAVYLFENMQTAVRLRYFFPVLRSLGGPAVGHYDDIRCEHLEFIFVRFVRGILYT